MRHHAALLRSFAVSALLVAADVSAQTLTEFPTGAGTIGGIATGTDGALWFTEPDTGSIGRITTTGTVSVFPLPARHTRPQQITVGADHSLWFTESDAIGRITLDGVVTEYTPPFTPFATSPVSITAGPDGNIWYTQSVSMVGRLTPDGGFTDFDTHYDHLTGITGGPDGNVWFTTSAEGESKICRITPDGAITQFGVYGELGGPQQIITGPDGNLWFTQVSPYLGRITTDGVITQYNIDIVASSIAAWNGDLYLSDGMRLLRVTTDGVVRGEISLATARPITAMTVGPDGKLWLVEAAGNVGSVAWPRRRVVQH